MSHPSPLTQQAGKIRPPEKRFLAGWRRDAVVCLSLANVFFTPEWEDLFSYRRMGDLALMRKTFPSPVDDAAVMTAVLLLAGLVFGAVRLARRHLGDRGFLAVPLAALALAAIPISGQRWNVEGLVLSLKSPVLAWMGYRSALLLIALACAPLLWPIWKYRRRIAAVVSGALVVLSPFCLLTFGQAVWGMATYRGQPYPDGPLAPRLAGAPPPVRVVWIIFDEWDYRLTFLERPAGLAMPQIDRLRGESLFATAAKSPFMETDQSLPSLITGRRLEGSVNASGSTVFVAPVGSREAKPLPWKESSTIFASVRESGFNVGLTGWYFPYCRIMNGPLSECAWWPLASVRDGINENYLAGSMGAGFWGRVGGYTMSLLETYHLHSGQSSAARYKVRQCLEFMAEAGKQVADPALGLVFLHVPVPHSPHPYNRFTGRMDGSDRYPIGYIDSLALTDRMMGELRATMESHGAWDHTVLLISADHPFRWSRDLDGKFDRRVPFLLRFPGRPAAAVYAPEFDTILSANLIYAILHGSVATVGDAAGWLDRHRGERESPVPPGN